MRLMLLLLSLAAPPRRRRGRPLRRRCLWLASLRPLSRSLLSVGVNYTNLRIGNWRVVIQLRRKWIVIDLRS